MKQPALLPCLAPCFVLCLALVASGAWAQPQEEAEDVVTLRVAAEHERIRRTRTSVQARFAELEAKCYERFAVNDCLIKVRGERRELLADLRRQEISLNDSERKRRGAEQLLRSDVRVRGAP